MKKREEDPMQDDEEVLDLTNDVRFALTALNRQDLLEVFPA